MYDFIGDIHGYADELELLLQKLDYRKQNGVYQHSSRKVVFLGDIVDRGPKIREALQIVKAMVDNNFAMSVMGNHEYNAIGYHTQNQQGGHYREHNERYTKQHSATVEQFADYQHEWDDYIRWFYTLPLFIETPQFRTIHASWISKYTDFITENLPANCLTENFLTKSFDRNTYEYLVIDQILKGVEIDLPKGLVVEDKEGIKRKRMRIKWWLPDANWTYKDIAFADHQCDNEEQIEFDGELFFHYSHHEKPLFIGHYWRSGHPMLLTQNICCLDYGIARGNKLVAYRFDGEKILTNEKFVFVEAQR